MTIDLFRIDERLLHGQVVVGWGEKLGVAYYVVVDDELADSEWEQEIYRGGLPEGVEAAFLGVDETVQRFEVLDDRPETGVLLTPGTSEMRRLAEADLLEGRRVNVGCLSTAPGRTKALDYVHLSGAEAEDLLATAEHVLAVTARDVPGGREVPLEELLEHVAHT